MQIESTAANDITPQIRRTVST